MNELQVRLTADISALQSALTKAKATIKSFESETAKESEKGNVGFKRKIGLIEQLTIKANSLRTALSKATNEAQIESYNKELQNTATELTRLNALGRSVSANLGGVGNGFGKVATQGANASGVAIEFNRVIQDAPFGLIGIGNNLQQLAGNFTQVSKSAGGTGAAIKASLGALVSPVNLALLAVSALTAGFTAYQMGAFDGLLATKDFGEELDKFRDSLSEADSARLESIKTSDQEIIKLNSLRAIIEDETISRDKRLLAVKELRDQFPTISKNLSDEAFLAGQVAGAYEAVTKQLIAKAEVESSVKRIVDLNDQERLILEQSKDKLDEINAVRARITAFQETANKNELILINSKDASERDLALRRKTNAENQIRFLRGENEEVNQLLKINEDRIKLTEIANNALVDTLVNTDKIVTANESVNDSLDRTAEKFGLISGITNQISELNKQRELSTSQEEINLITGKIELLKEELTLINAIAKRSNTPVDLGITATLPSRDGNPEVVNPALEAGIIPDLGTEVFQEQADEIINTNALIKDSFGALGAAIGSNLNISNDALKGFVTTLLSNAPKIISAIIAQAQASNKAADIANKGNLKQAIGNSVVTATNTAKSLGPIGLAALPVLIGGALALVTSAFGKGGRGGGSGGVSAGSSSGAPPQMFTNVNTVQPPTPTSPNYSGSSIDFDNAQSRMTVDIDGDKLKFIVDRADERKKAGG